MIVSRMTVSTDSAGRTYLGGHLRFALEKGAILTLRKADDGSYSLIALSGDGRPEGDRSRQSLLSFVGPEVMGLETVR